jgi:hypothetical protein
VILAHGKPLRLVSGPLSEAGWNGLVSPAVNGFDRAPLAQHRVLFLLSQADLCEAWSFSFFVGDEYPLPCTLRLLFACVTNIFLKFAFAPKVKPLVFTPMA